MDPKLFIEQRIHDLSTVTHSVRSEDMIADIYKVVMSKKFRKYSVTPDHQNLIKKIIETSVRENKPLQFVWVFGGYKLWSLNEAPEVDWAELFSLIYFVNWLKPITKFYKPGVVFDFFSDDVIVPFMNNVPKADTDSYIKSFRNLLQFLQPYLPKGFTYSFNRVEDQYKNYQEFETELKIRIKSMESTITTFKLTDKQIAAIDLNVAPNEKQKQVPLWREKVQIIHDAYSKMEKRRPYYRNPEKIMVLNTPIPGALAVGTTKTSVVKFWIGAGALETREESYIERILAPSQLKKISFKKEKIEIKELTGKNFQSIKIVTS